MEIRHVAGEPLRGVALGINRDEQNLHPRAVRTKPADHLSQVDQGCRTDVGATGKAEEEQLDLLVVEIGQPAREAPMVDELEVPSPGD